MCKCIIFASKASPLRSVSCCAHFTVSGSARTFRHLLAVRKKYVLCTHVSFDGGAADAGRVSFSLSACAMCVYIDGTASLTHSSHFFFLREGHGSEAVVTEKPKMCCSKSFCVFSAAIHLVSEHLETNTSGTDVIPPDHFSKHIRY